MAKNLKIGKNKYINILLRFQNKAWVAVLLTQIINMVIFFIRAFGGDVSGSTEETIGSIVQVVAFGIATTVGHVMDGSSEGAADSKRNLAKTKLTTNGEQSMQAIDYDGSTLPPVKPFLEQKTAQESTNSQSKQNSEETLGGGSVGETDQIIESDVSIDSNYNPEVFGGGSNDSSQ